MSKKKVFNFRVLFSFLFSMIVISASYIVFAGSDLEKDIKNDLTAYANSLNKGEISNYYNIYNTRKLTDIEKSLLYEKIKNTTKIVESEIKTYEKFRFKLKIKDVNILRKINNNLYLCNISVAYQMRENVETTKTIKKTEDYILKILYTGKDGYKILLPFNSKDKDFSGSEIFIYLEQQYKDKKAKEIENERAEQELDIKQEQESLKENMEQESQDNLAESDEIIETNNEYSDEYRLEQNNTFSDIDNDSESISSTGSDM